MSESLSEFFNDQEFVDTNLAGDDLFSILESLDGLAEFPTSACSNDSNTVSPKETTKLVSQKSSFSNALLDSETELETSSPKSKKQKLMGAVASSEDANPRMSHITVERNRRKQMNEHLSVLRSLMPSFYVKRGDQASIIGGVVEYINELQTVLQSLEAKKQRKFYNEVLSPRPSPRPTSQISPRKPPLSPRLNLPISPRTPQPGSPYRPRLHPAGYISPTIASPLEPSPSPSSTSSSIDSVNELVANSKSQVADVEVKFSGPNLLLKTVSPRFPGQAMKIISALDELALEILQVSINTVDETLLNSFTIKIGIECQLSAEELAQQIQRTFSHVPL